MKVAFLFLFFFNIHPVSKKPEMPEVRQLFQNAAIEEKSCRQLILLLEPYDGTANALFLGYKASAMMMMASHVFNPVSKFNYFKNGRNMLEQAIKIEPKNVELRLLRFLAQTNIPFFLNYNGEIENDKLFLLQHISEVKDSNSRAYIISNLMTSKALSKEEKLSLQQDGKLSYTKK